jgi:hypothetical protein
MRISVARATVALSILAGWSFGLLAAVRRADSPVAAAIMGPFYTVPLISLWEWLVHGVLYHRRIPGLGVIRRIHHAGHHFALFPPQHYVQSGPYPFMNIQRPLRPYRMASSPAGDALTRWAQVALHFVVGLPSIILPAWMATGDTVFVGSSLLTLAAISWLLAYVHGVIHTPRERWIEGHRWFQWLDRHHYIHHVDPSANINFLLPLCDVLFGTRKAALTEREARANPSYEQARRGVADGRPQR